LAVPATAGLRGFSDAKRHRPLDRRRALL